MRLVRAACRWVKSQIGWKIGQDLRHGAADRLAPRDNRLMRDLAVPGFTLRQQGLDPPPGVGRRKERPALIATQALPQVGRARLKEDHMSALSHQTPALRIDHRAAAGCEHDRSRLDELGDECRLPPSKSGLALELEDRCDGYPAPPLEFHIGIHERTAERCRELAPDGRLSTAHHPNEYQIAHRPD